MSSIIRIEGPSNPNAGPYPMHYHSQGTLPLHPHPHQHQQPPPQQYQYSHTLPRHPLQQQHPTAQPVYSRPSVPSYQQAYTMRPAPTNLSRPAPAMMSQSAPSMSMQMPQQYMTHASQPQQNRGAVYAMALNSSKTLNIQLGLQGGLQGLSLGGGPPAQNGGPAPSLQRQDSSTSSARSSTGVGSSSTISTEAEVYGQPPEVKTQSPEPATTPASSGYGEIVVTSPTPSTSSSTQTEANQPAPTKTVGPETSKEPPPEETVGQQSSESDSTRGSLQEAGSQEDTGSLQSYSSGGARSDVSWDLLPTGAEASNFEFGNGEDVPPEPELRPCRVGMVVTPGSALMIKVVLGKDELGDDPKLLDLVADIMDVCWKEILKQAKDEMINLNAEQLGKLKLKDGKTCKEHMAEMTSNLGDTVELSEGIFRKYEEATQCHVANYMYEIVKTRGGCTLGKTGVVICVRKKNKYAPVDAFCEQLCEHIAVTKPRWTGKLDLSKFNKRNPAHVQSLAELGRKGFLLPQTFLFDPTITVAEAAKRAFVEVIDFAFYR